MAILKSKQISTHLSGSYVITGSLETTANISGSATSTGSFGKLITKNADIQDSVGNTLIGYDPGNIGNDDEINFKIGDVDNATTNAHLRFDFVNKGLYFNDLDELFIPQDIVHTGDTNTKIEFGTDKITLRAGNNPFVVNTTSISGSATSTGSFGSLETSGNINSSGRIFESGTSVIDHATAMAIVFGG